MGEILGLGLSHYPNIRGTDDQMANILRGNLQRPDIPESVKDPATWPEPMRREWGDDEGRSFAPLHRAEFLKHLRVVTQELEAFKPDFLLIWGDDQYENFHDDLVPPFCIYAYDDMELRPFAPRPGPTGVTPPPSPANVWGLNEDYVLKVPGKRDAAKYLARELLGRKIDVAYSYRPLHYEGLSHAFLNAVLYFNYDLAGWQYPIVPFAVNCYGSRVTVNKGGRFPVGKIEVPEGDLDPPAPSPERCMEVGAATARALAKSPWRVAIVASSSWSHAFLTPKHYFLHPDMASDRELYTALKTGDYATWRKRTVADVEDAGQQEVLNWWCLAGAMEALGRKPDYCAYVESYVMNSNKCFAVYKP